MAKSVSHPLDPLGPREISQAAEYVRQAHPDNEVYFRVITLAEPAKVSLLPFLDVEHQGSHSVPAPPRLARVQFYLGQRTSQNYWEVKVNLDSGTVVKKEQLTGRHTHVDANDMQHAERACLRDQRVRAALRDLRLPEGATVVVEPWTYGTDGAEDMNHKIIMCYFYMRLSSHLDANLYAYPLDICAEMSGDLKVLKVYPLPDIDGSACTSFKPFDRRVIHTESEYHPDLVADHRRTTKPYQVTQSEGPSFTNTGNLVEWEKWSFRVGFNYREGLTLHDIRYTGRPLFYRISLSEMFVPYGDPRSPYIRKAAFDLGSDGAGVCANNLQLGCDCLGHVKYFSAWHNTHTGDPLKLPNVVCCHEIDDGILWKHTNHRTGNAVVARSRVLVLQTVITVSNYEYIFAFHFSQDASIHYEVRATGILSTAPIRLDQKVPYGTIVAPGVMAPYHQHLFCLRMDPNIAGPNNTLVVEESHPLPIDNPEIHNPFGVGYTTKSQPIEHEAGLDLDHTKNRIFKIVNENVTNSIAGTNVGFKLLPSYSQLLLAHPSSYHAKRSEFGKHAVWVTRYHDDELYPSGKFTMQSMGNEGIESWIKNRAELSPSTLDSVSDPDTVASAVTTNTNSTTNGTHDSSPTPAPVKNEASNVRNTDIVVWHTFGSTHNPRIEDWPVMPCEKMVVGLKPVNFFERSPAVDVLPAPVRKRNSDDNGREWNGSVLVDGESDEEDGPLNGTTGGEEATSCVRTTGV